MIIKPSCSVRRWALSRDTTQAEDIVHFAFLRIIKHIEKVSSLPGDELKGYIVLIIRNLSIDFLRRKKKENTVPIEKLDYETEVSAEDIAMTKLEMGQVKEHLRAMNDKYSLPLILKYSLGFSHTEIADMLGISADNVKIRCHRGKRMLIEAISREGEE